MSSENTPIIDPDQEGAERHQYVIRRDRGSRLDKYLQNRLKGISRTRVQKLIAYGGVTVNGEVPKPSKRLYAGDVVDVILPPPAVRQIEAEPIPLTILHEDADVIVLNKQAGLIIHPAPGHPRGTLVNGLAHHLSMQGAEQLSAVGGEEARPGIVHRLDRDTTGVMVVAKRDEAHWSLARQFEKRSPLKVYLALVHGNPEVPSGALEHPIGKHPTIHEAYAVRHHRDAKHALTLYRVREQYRGYALVELELKTGRTHQIRVHLGYVGHPIVGDTMYGGEPLGAAEIAAPPRPAGHRPMLSYARTKSEGRRALADAEVREDMLLSRPALHAGLLRFLHPSTRNPVTFQAPLHEPMSSAVGALRARPADGPTAREGCWIDPNAL